MEDDPDFHRKLSFWMSGNASSGSVSNADLDTSRLKLHHILKGASNPNSNISTEQLHAVFYNGTTPDSARMDGRHILIIILAIIAIVMNGVTLMAIKYIRRRLTANQTMMFSLCCSDLLTAVAILGRVIDQQLFAIDMVEENQRMAAICVYKIIQAIVMTGHISTLCNLLCLAVDHYCAIAKPLTYSIYMSKSRVHIILTVSWTLSVLFGFSDFLLPVEVHGHCADMDLQNYCSRVYCTKYEPDHLMFCVVLVCLGVMMVMYGCIMWILYKYQQQDYVSVTQRKAQRHVRGLITSFIILGLFAALWLPNCLMDAHIIIRQSTMKLSRVQTIAQMAKNFNLARYSFWYLYALVIVNAICDPVVYAMRMRDINESLKLLLCFKRPTFNNKMRRFGENQKQNSNSSIPLKYVQRQFSNSTNVTACSGNNIPASGSTNSTNHERKIYSRNGTITSQMSEEEIPLHRQSSLTQNETDFDDQL